MVELTDADITRFVGQYIWPLVRISAFLLAAPIFGSQIITGRVRLVLSVVMTFLVMPLLPPLPAFPGISLSVLLITLQQAVIGLALGFTFQIVFQVFVLAGQYIAMKMGLGFASMNDPANGVTVTIISQFYLLVTTLLFLSLNGHLILVQIIVDSFNTMPVGAIGFGGVQFSQIAGLGSWMFSSALSIALPILTALLIVNIAFGVMSRAAPQINIFVVGFPITLIFGLLLMWLGFGAFLPNLQNFITEGFGFGQNLLSPK